MQCLMDEGDGDRSLADGRRHPFHIARPYVPNCKYPRKARLQEMRRPVKGPARASQFIRR